MIVLNNSIPDQALEIKRTSLILLFCLSVGIQYRLRRRSQIVAHQQRISRRIAAQIGQKLPEVVRGLLLLDHRLEHIRNRSVESLQRPDLHYFTLL